MLGTRMHSIQENPVTKMDTTYTVRTQSKIDTISEKKRKQKETTVCLAIVKWISTGLLFLTMVFCLVTSKVSLILIAKHLRSPKLGSDSEPKETSDNSMTAFVMIILLMVIPEFVNFFRALRQSAFVSGEVWPSKKALVIGMFSALLESFGLIIFTMILIPATEKLSTSTIYMNGVFLFPLIMVMLNKTYHFCKGESFNVDYDNSQVIRSNLQHQQPVSSSCCKQSNRIQIIVLFTVGILCCISGLVFIVIETDEKVVKYGILPAVLCLSIAWSPKLFKMQIQPAEVNDPVNEDPDVFEDSMIFKQIRRKTARHRMTLISSAIKIFLLFFLPFLICKYLNITQKSNPLKSLHDGFLNFLKSKRIVTMFFLQLFSSLMGSMTAWATCTMNLQKICFVIPILITTPLSVSLLSYDEFCKEFIKMDASHCESNLNTMLFGLVWLAQLMFLIYFFKPQQFLKAREELLFWLPTYNGCLLEQHLLVNRKNEICDEQVINYHEIVKESHIYICTTMYHEADYEMEQLLHSLSKIDQARRQSGRQFEAHIFLDDGARGEVVKWYALQLLSLVKETMGIDPGKSLKLETPYGLQLKWRLPDGMPFILHLKDKIKVKSKKRWSQVMYMSYVLDFKENKERDDLTYILATDADVKFNPDDVMALMDLMSCNPNIGAVCGRTHPMGSGPMVWYQIFDYAIGHWLLKVANHVMGSVLCSPGCFSVYRAKAVRDVLPLYASGVDCAMDFLMKDMGEDRWFCTLLVEAGWKLEYCATAVDHTYCPETFDEFFKQRRRWGPSTLANSLVVLNKQKTIRENNDSISLFFIFYQVVLMVSSIIGPSTVILIIAGGLNYAFPYSTNMIVILVLLILVTVVYTFICLYCKQDTQLKAAKLLTFGFAIIMSITIVGLLLQTVNDIHSYEYPPTIAPHTTPRHGINSTVHHNHTVKYDPFPYIFPPATWYLLIITSVFIITAILHGLEAFFLIHGIWYLLCLPSGYLLLTIYSVANLTDRSWGTREGKIQSQGADSSAVENLTKYIKHICWCCVPPHLRAKSEEQKETKVEEEVAVPKNEEEQPEKDAQTPSDDEPPSTFTEDHEADNQSTSMAHAPVKSAKKKSNLKKFGGSVDSLNKVVVAHNATRGFRFPGQEKSVSFAPRPRLRSASTVQEWLAINAPPEYQTYIQNFVNEGYDDTAFIAGAVKEKDLRNIGITNRGHRKKLMLLIESLPAEEVFQEVPESVEEWLIGLGLEEYWPTFQVNSYTEPRDLADMKYMTRENISILFDIKKEGHLKRLLTATSALQYPTKAQTKIRETRKAVMAEPARNLMADNCDDGAEFMFWEELKQICLLPEQAAFNQSGELVEKLRELRDTSLLVLTVTNVIWLTFIITVMQQGKNLNLLGSSFASVAFLIVYGVVLLLQFASMLWHRVGTAIHFIARAPFKPGHLKSNWAWRDDDLPPPPDQDVLNEIRRKRRRHSSAGSNDSNSLRTPLIRS